MKKVTLKILAEQLLEKLYEKMFFRKPLAEDGWAINEIVKTLHKGRRIKTK